MPWLLRRPVLDVFSAYWLLCCLLPFLLLVARLACSRELVLTLVAVRFVSVAIVAAVSLTLCLLLLLHGRLLL